MGENTKIEWTHHTFNPWIGCSRVHAGCAHCYAEADFDKRRHVAQWGAHGTRVVTSPDNWKKPPLWNRKAAEAGERHRVFCASLADVFEDFDGPMQHHRGDRLGVESPRINPQLFIAHESYEMRPGERWATLHHIRTRLFDLIDATPHLDWLLLTKRPENIRRMWGVRACQECTGMGAGTCPTCGRNGPEEYRPNVWLGTSISDQSSADKQIPQLLKCRDLSPVLFLSCEPLLGPIDLSAYLSQWRGEGVDWVIAGGESGPDARPMHDGWVRSLCEQCDLAAATPFFFKQWGEWGPVTQPIGGAASKLFDDDLSKCEFGEFEGNTFVPGQFAGTGRSTVVNVGKKAAGNMLDGTQHLAFPEVAR